MFTFTGLMAFLFLLGLLVEEEDEHTCEVLKGGFWFFFILAAFSVL